MGSERGPICFSNGSTNAVRLYLRNLQLKFLDVTYDETAEEIGKIIESDPASKWLCHNVLFLHMSVEELLEKKKEMKYFALINLDWNPITPKFYMDTVFHCHLHEYFLQMIYVARSRDFSRKLVAYAVQRIMSPDLGSKSKLLKEELLLYMSFLPRICSPGVPFQHEYRNLWTELVSYFLELPNQEVSVMCKVEFLVRVAGIMCSKAEDYEGSSEIADSIRELDFDPCVGMYGSFAFQFFSELFSAENEDMRGLGGSSEIINILQCLISDFKFDNEDENAQIFLGTKTRISKNKSRILLRIGDCSYLTNLLLNKNVLGSDDAPEFSKLAAEKIQSVTNFLEKFKSKSRYEDYNERTMTFGTFCKLLRTNINHRHSQTSWYEKFFTYEEAFSTSEGFSIAQDIVAPAVSLDLGIRMLRKIRRMTSPIPDPLKSIALILAFNDNVYPHFGLVVDLVFKYGLHDHLSLSGFQEELNQLNVRLGSDGSFCRKTRMLSATVVEECRRVTLQNPLAATENLLLRILQLPLCQSAVVECLVPFWRLLTPTENLKDASITQKSVTLLECSLVRVIGLVIDPLNRNLLMKFNKFFPVILEQGLISKEAFQQLCVDIIASSVETYPMDKLVSLLEIYKELVIYVLSLPRRDDSEFIRCAYTHAVGFREASYISSMECHSMRNKAIEIIRLLLEVDESLLKVIPPGEENFDSLSVIQLVLLYVRNPGRRDAIRCYLNSPGYTYGDVDVSVNDFEEMVEASSSEEWTDLLEILFVIMVVKHRGQANPMFFQLITQVPLYEVAKCEAPVPEDTDDSKKRKKRAVLGEFEGPPLIFQRFGSYLVDILTSPKDPFRFVLYPLNQLELLKVFVAVSCYFPDEPQYFAAKQSALMSLLDLVTWLISNHTDGEFRQQCLLITLALEKTQHGKLGPICQSIIEVLKPQQSGIIPV